MLIGLGQTPQFGPAPPPDTDAPVDPALEAQALKFESDPRLQTVAAWAENPTATAQLEATTILTELEKLRNDAVPLARDLEQIYAEIIARRANIQRNQAETAALASGQQPQPPRLSGLAPPRRSVQRALVLARENPDMHGFSLRKTVSNISSSISNAVSSATSSVSNALKEVDKAAIRPWSAPLNEALKEVDKAVIRPWSQPLNEALKKFEKSAIRPVGKQATKGMAVLDKYVPGWATVLDFVMPLPVGTILKAFQGKNLISAAASAVGFGDASVIGNLAKLSDSVVNDAFKSAVSVTSNDLIKTLPLTIAKGTNTFLTTQGPFLTKLRATATEAVSGFGQVLSLAAIVLSFGTLTPAVTAMMSTLRGLSAILSALKAGISVITATEAATALRKEARAIQRAANDELAKIAAEDRATQAELDRIRAQIAAIKAERERLAALQRKKAMEKASEPTLGFLSTRPGQSGIPLNALLLGGALLIGGVVLISALDEEE